MTVVLTGFPRSISNLTDSDLVGMTVRHLERYKTIVVYTPCRSNDSFFDLLNHVRSDISIVLYYRSDNHVPMLSSSRRINVCCMTHTNPVWDLDYVVRHTAAGSVVCFGDPPYLWRNFTSLNHGTVRVLFWFVAGVCALGARGTIQTTSMPKCRLGCRILYHR